MRKLKVFGLTLLAIGALSAMTAALASANYNIASATGGTVSGSQEGEHVFTTDVGNVKCKVATFEGSQAAETATTLTITPKYENCTLAGQKVTITFQNGCKYLFETPTTTEPTGTTDANVRVCQNEAGVAQGSILIKDTAGLGCEVTVGPQTVGHVMMTNEPANNPDTVFVEATVTKIKYSYTKQCPNAKIDPVTKLPTGETVENGTYFGNVRISGKNSVGAPVDIKVT